MERETFFGIVVEKYDYVFRRTSERYEFSLVTYKVFNSFLIPFLLLRGGG